MFRCNALDIDYVTTAHRHRLLHSTRLLGNKEEEKYLEVTRIYSDGDGRSQFGSFKIRMKGSGEYKQSGRDMS